MVKACLEDRSDNIQSEKYSIHQFMGFFFYFMDYFTLKVNLKIQYDYYMYN